MTELDTKSTGPRTEEGKQRSSQNSLKHGLFAQKSFLLPGETQEEFDRHLYRYHREYQPKGATEEDLVDRLAETEWRRRRIPVLEADSIEKSLESGDAERKFMDTYSIYEQRFHRIFQSLLKDLHEVQAWRKKATGIDFRVAAIINNYCKLNNIAWNPADDGFVFSTDLLSRRFELAEKIKHANKVCTHNATGEEMDILMAKPAY